MDDFLPILLIVFVFLWMRRIWKRSQAPVAHRVRRHHRLPTEIIPCDRCGTYVPRTEATRYLGKTYCCPEHTPRHGAKKP
ncbi:MAG: PP0621 family protein [Acidiferrobacteraceae bacterium]